MGRFFEIRYAELRCRKCKKTFCCKDCRLKHEQKIHFIDPECHVCVYGKISFSSARASTQMLQHLQMHHWPMHCVKCGLKINTAEDMGRHSSKCPGMATVVVDEKQAQYLSPELMGNKAKFESVLAMTSTPMANNQMGIKVPDDITPVDSDRAAPQMERITKSEKKVTFLTTPALENIRMKRKNPDNLLKSSLKNSIRLNDSQAFFSLSAIEESSSFKPAKDKIIVEPVSGAKESERSNPKRLSRSMSETMWMSAINTSLDLENVNDKIIPQNASLHLSLQDSHADCCNSVQDAGTSYDASPPKAGVWASVTSLFKNVKNAVKSFAHPMELHTSLKRNRSMTDSETDLEERILKRYKLYDVKCRPPIRPNWKHLVPKVDKCIQTDFYDED